MHFIPCTLRFTTENYAMLFAFFIASRPKAGPQTVKARGPLLKRSAPRRVTMPAIASLEDLKAARKEGLSIYAMLYALCSMLHEDGAGSAGKIFVSCGYRSVPQSN